MKGQANILFFFIGQIISKLFILTSLIILITLSKHSSQKKNYYIFLSL